MSTQRTTTIATTVTRSVPSQNLPEQENNGIVPRRSAAGGYTLSREALSRDLYKAYLDARKGKRGKPYQMAFEMHLEDNLSELCVELRSRTYKPRPSKCFIIEDPTLREVFAADFRDRVVHHLYYNYTYVLFDRTFIDDSYSCRKGRGTLYGVERLEHHIKAESRNYTRGCYVLKMDISGYFMHIDRRRLLELSLRTLRREAHKPSRIPGRRWMDVIDMDFVEYLTREIVLLNPVENCRVFGRRSDWKRLPRSKSLYYSPDGCGLPIGNLTSQVFSNVYMNSFDQWMKRCIGCRHYGRYVDDFYVVSCDKRFLLSVAEYAAGFLWSELGLRVNPCKTILYDVGHGVPFLGCHLLPWRKYIGRATFERMKRHLEAELVSAGPLRLRSVVNSYLGLLRHVNSYRFSQRYFRTLPRLAALGNITPFKRKLVLSPRVLDTMRINSYLRMIDDPDCLLDYSDVELLCHEYVDMYFC